MHAALPALPPRDTRLDLVRGWLQLTIFASHSAGSWIGGWLIHGAWGLSDSSELFVLLSGCTLGSVFARNAARGGWGGAARDMLRRAARLWRTQLAVFALFGALAVAAGETALPGEARRLGWGFLLDDPARAVPAALVMLYQPAYMGILPVFIWCMLALPLFAALEARAGDWALAAPLLGYAGAQLFGLAAPSLAPGGGIGFNPFAWQALFLLGAWRGRRALLCQPLPRPRWAWAPAVAILLAGLLLRLHWYGWLPWPAPVAESAALVGKEDLAPPRLLHALALAWLVAVLVPREAAWMHHPALRWLAPVGRHSLQVFCLGLFLAWGVSAAFRLWPGMTGRPVPWWLDPLLIGAGGLALALYARGLDRTRVARPAPALARG